MLKNKAQLEKIVLDCFECLMPINKTLDKKILDNVLRGYCLDNLILLNNKNRVYVLNRLALKVKNAQKIDSDFNKKYIEKLEEEQLKSFKVLIEVRAYNEADMREIVEQANDSEIEWWAMCGE